MKINSQDTLGLISWLTLSFLALWIFFILLQISGLDFFRHDAGYYLPAYETRFTQEGRWLNFLLFDLIKSLSPYIHVFGYFILAFVFFYRVGIDLCKDQKLSLCFALLCISTPTFYSLILWPVSPFLSFFVMNFLFWYRKRTSYKEILFLSGLLCFGTYSNLHFITPLIYLSKLRVESFRFTIKFFIWWVLTFLIGYVLVNLLVYVVTFIKLDSPSFIKLASWREPNPIDSFSNLYANSTHIYNVIISNITESYLCFVLISFFFVVSLGKAIKEIKLITWVLLIFFSFYMSNLYHGISIDYRSLPTSFISLYIAFIAINKRFGIFVCLVLTSILTYGNQHKINWFEARTLEVVDRFRPVKQDLDDAVGTAYVHLNKKNRDHYFLTEVDIPYEFANLNNLRYKQIRPYFLEQGIEEVEFIYTDTPYTGGIRSEFIEGQLHVYLE